MNVGCPPRRSGRALSPAARAVDIIECYGSERLWLNSACDWGISVPLAVPYAGLEMRRRQIAAEKIDQLLFGNPQEFLTQNPRFTALSSTTP